MTISDWVVVIAIILAPIVAVQIQKLLEKRQTKTERQINVFKTLMSTRATPVSIAHVEALNMIDIEFYDNKKITEAWKLLLDHFGNYPNTDDPQHQTKLDACIEKSKALLIDLLYEMGTSLNYHFDKVHLKRGVYHPKGHADVFTDQEFIRKSLIGIFKGNIPIPIKLINKIKEEN
jgi:hypothetical protein